jgi:GNAT superfamily N-acetyltransferase
VPAIILTRLAVDRTEAGHGLGRALLKDAFHRVLRAGEIVGIRVLLIHAETERARDWYMKIARFEQKPADDLPLLLLTKDLRRTVTSEGG